MEVRESYNVSDIGGGKGLVAACRLLVIVIVAVVLALDRSCNDGRGAWKAAEVVVVVCSSISVSVGTTADAMSSLFEESFIISQGARVRVRVRVQCLTWILFPKTAVLVSKVL